MIKRTLMALGLSLALLGGVSATAHASSRVVGHHVVGHHASAQSSARANLRVGDTGDQGTDPDANAPCGTAPATGDQTGNCENSQNSSDRGNDTGTADQGGADQAETPTPGQ